MSSCDRFVLRLLEEVLDSSSRAAAVVAVKVMVSVGVNDEAELFLFSKLCWGVLRLVKLPLRLNDRKLSEFVMEELDFRLVL